MNTTMLLLAIIIAYFVIRAGYISEQMSSWLEKVKMANINLIANNYKDTYLLDRNRRAISSFQKILFCRPWIWNISKFVEDIEAYKTVEEWCNRGRI